MGITATAAFYVSSIVWCCMPRSDPFCCAKGNRNIERQQQQQQNEEKSKDYNSFYGANTFETQDTNKVESQFNDTTTPSVADTMASNSWANSDNRGLIPQQQQHQPSSDFGAPMGYGNNYSGGGSYEASPMDPPAYNAAAAPPAEAWQDHTAEWSTHDTTNPMNATHDEPFANPFSLEEPNAGGTGYPPSRPAYGNLQG